MGCRAAAPARGLGTLPIARLRLGERAGVDRHHRVQPILVDGDAREVLGNERVRRHPAVRHRLPHLWDGRFDDRELARSDGRPRRMRRRHARIAPASNGREANTARITWRDSTRSAVAAAAHFDARSAAPLHTGHASSDRSGSGSSNSPRGASARRARAPAARRLWSRRASTSRRAIITASPAHRRPPRRRLRPPPSRPAGDRARTHGHASSAAARPDAPARHRSPSRSRTSADRCGSRPAAAAEDHLSRRIPLDDGVGGPLREERSRGVAGAFGHGDDAQTRAGVLMAYRREERALAAGLLGHEHQVRRDLRDRIAQALWPPQASRRAGPSSR